MDNHYASRFSDNLYSSNQGLAMSEAFRDDVDY